MVWKCPSAAYRSGGQYAGLFVHIGDDIWDEDGDGNCEEGERGDEEEEAWERLERRRCPEGVTRTLCGFMALWRMLCSWSASSAIVYPSIHYQFLFVLV